MYVLMQFYTGYAEEDGMVIIHFEEGITEEMIESYARDSAIDWADSYGRDAEDASFDYEILDETMTEEDIIEEYGDIIEEA